MLSTAYLREHLRKRGDRRYAAVVLRYSPAQVCCTTCLKIYSKLKIDIINKGIVVYRFANLPYEIEMQDYSGGANGHDSKEEIELRSLENCPHIINNPINSLTYPYAAAALAGCYSSQSLPRRNPSLISNPLDSYYVDNELASLRHLAQGQQRRRSASTSTATRVRNSPRSRRTSLQCCEDEAAAQRRDSRTNVDDLATAGENSTFNNIFK